MGHPTDAAALPGAAPGGLDQRVRDLVASGDVGEAATEALRSLGPQILRYLHGLSWVEIATIFADEGHPIEESALAKRFQRLKERLSRMAEAEGFLDP